MCTTGQESAFPHLDDVGLSISKLVKLFELEDTAVLLSDTETRGFLCCRCYGWSDRTRRQTGSTRTGSQSSFGSVFSSSSAGTGKAQSGRAPLVVVSR